MPYPVSANDFFWSRGLRHVVLLSALSGIFAGIVLAGVATANAWDPREGFPDLDQIGQRMDALAAKSDYCRLEYLAKTRGHRPLALIKLGTGRVDQKPTVLLVAGADAEQFSSAAIALSLTEQVISDAESGGPWKENLDRYTLCLLPVASPDAYAKAWAAPRWETSRNSRPWDEDGDGRIDEDGPDDLDGDGQIVMMRIADAEGDWVEHPHDHRVMVHFEAGDVGRPRYRLISEGVDNDHDGTVNEDPPGGTAFNRNFPFDYPFFAGDAGPWQVSDPETQALADLVLHQGNIAAVVVLGLEDNMLKPWTPEASAEAQKVKKRILADDFVYFDPLAKFYRERTGFSQDAESRGEGGSFYAWAYFHAGCWAFAARTWVPASDTNQPGQTPSHETLEVSSDQEMAGEDVSESEGPKSAQDTNRDAAEDQQHVIREDSDKEGTAGKGANGGQAGDTNKDNDKRGAFQRAVLAFWESQGKEAFVPWRRYKHPDFPGREVEIGGFLPGAQWNPPPDLVDELAEKHAHFVAHLMESLPRLRIARSSLEPLGGGLYRLTVEVENVGRMPTVPKMGEVNGQPYPIRVELAGEGWELIQGFRKTLLDPLPGGGGRQELRWILRRRDDVSRLRVQITAQSPHVGKASKTIESSAERISENTW